MANMEQTNKKNSIRTQFDILKTTIQEFMGESCLKYSASLAYYTVFSVGPILVLMMSLAGLFLGSEAIEGAVFSELRGLVGASVARQVQEVIQNLSLSGKSTLALTVSLITLLLGATTVFGDIQHSINSIWHVRPKVKKGWLKVIKDRLLSSSLVIGLGFLLVVTLVVNGVLLAITGRLQRFLPDLTVSLFNILNFALSFGIVFLLFAIIFKVLPDVNIKWKTVRTGAFFTAILFAIGRFAIGFYLERSDTESTYGAAGAIVLMLLWVYYTAAILYLGAVYTRQYAIYKNIPIEPSEFAVYVEVKEREKEVAVLPTDEMSTEGNKTL